MPRIISDFYSKENKHILGRNPHNEFNQRILAVNNMYGWLYKQGFLEEASFVYKDYAAYTFFALDVKNLASYRREMEESGIEGALLAVKHIFDEAYSPCRYSGVIQPGWRMSTYRNVDGCVGSSWECDLVQDLNTQTAETVYQIKEKQGIHAAVTFLYDLFTWDLTLKEQALYQTALEHFGPDANGVEHIEGISPRKLIYCYENNMDLMDFDFWCRYEELCGVDLTCDEFLAINETFDGDPYDIEETDLETIDSFKKILEAFRSSQSSDKKNALSERIQDASVRTVAPDSADITSEKDSFFGR